MERVLTQNYSMIPSLTLLPVKYEYGGSPCGRIIPMFSRALKKRLPRLRRPLFIFIYICPMP